MKCAMILFKKKSSRKTCATTSGKGLIRDESGVIVITSGIWDVLGK
jgi:hypothetical protein